MSHTDRRPDGGEPEELTRRLRVAVTRLHRRLRQESLEGLSPAQAAALGTMDRLREATLGELASVEQVQPPTMTRIVDALEAAGLVIRQTQSADRRVTRIVLTEEGTRTIKRIRRLKNAYLERRLDELDPTARGQVDTLVHLLEFFVEEA